MKILVVPLMANEKEVKIHFPSFTDATEKLCGSWHRKHNLISDDLDQVTCRLCEWRLESYARSQERQRNINDPNRKRRPSLKNWKLPLATKEAISKAEAVGERMRI